MSKIAFFLCVLLFFSIYSTGQAAVLAVSIVSSEQASPAKSQKFSKQVEKKRKKIPRSNFAGLEAYGYIALFFLVMILMGIGLILSLVFQWTIAAWIFGAIFGLQLLICLIFFFGLLFF